MVNTAFGGKLFEQLPTGNRGRKGIGYTIEAFMAVLTLFIFAVGSLNAPAGQDWNRYQLQVSARDISYTLQETGNMESFLERGETGSIQTVASTLTGGRQGVSGSIEGLPIGERSIGFHVLDSQINITTPVDVATADSNRCYENDDLEEIDSEGDILRTEDPHHGVYLYIADSDPQNASGYDSTTNYDSVWVDNGTRCQFSISEGPYYQGEFFWWGNASDSEPDMHYDLENITDTGELTLYQAKQPVRFQKVIKGDVNGVETDVTVDTFNFSATDLESYDTLVFREQEGLTDVNDNEDRVMEYLEESSALFLVDLSSSDLSSGFMSRTGLEWKALGTSGSISGAAFTDAQGSGRVENLFLGHSGTRSGVSLQPGGTISSGELELVHSRTGEYNRDEWNATNMSMDVTSSPPPGVADSSCSGGGNYRQGTFEFEASGETLDVWSSELGDDCTDDTEIWGLSIDLDGDDTIQGDEKIFVTGDTVTFDGREYTVKMYPDSQPGCDPGECGELLYAGSRHIEIVNARTYFPGQDIGGFARAGYESSYSLEDRRLLSAVIYWLGGRQNSFGGASGGLSTTAVGGVKNTVYMPYRVNLRWE